MVQLKSTSATHNAGDAQGEALQPRPNIVFVAGFALTPCTPWASPSFKEAQLPISARASGGESELTCCRQHAMHSPCDAASARLQSIHSDLEQVGWEVALLLAAHESHR